MSFSEFKKLMGADPLNQDPETLRARNSAPGFEAAATEAEAFEEKLQAALNVAAPVDLLADIKSITEQPAKRRNWMPLAMAASVLLVIGAAGIVWKQTHSWDSVEAYVQDHYGHDGGSVLADATSFVANEDIINIMSRFGANVDETLSERIKFIKYCPTPDGKGVHMVVSTDQGPMTVLYMPETDVINGEIIQFDQQHALLVSLQRGSAVIIGEKSQAIQDLEPTLRSSLKTS